MRLFLFYYVLLYHSTRQITIFFLIIFTAAALCFCPPKAKNLPPAAFFTLFALSGFESLPIEKPTPPCRGICAAGATRKKVVAAVSRCERLQANRRAERAFLRQRRNDGAYDRFFCKEKSEWSKVHSDVVGVAGLEPTASCSQSRRATSCATPRNGYIL